MLLSDALICLESLLGSDWVVRGADADRAASALPAVGFASHPNTLFEAWPARFSATARKRMRGLLDEPDDR